MDKIFKGKLLVRKEGEGESARLVDDMRTKFDLASIEGVKFKRLIGAVRTLWRSSPKGNHPHVNPFEIPSSTKPGSPKSATSRRSLTLSQQILTTPEDIFN